MPHESPTEFHALGRARLFVHAPGARALQFDAMLRDWYRSHRNEPVSTDEFEKFAAKAAGQDLAPWFAEWSNLKALPRLESNVSVDGHHVTADPDVTVLADVRAAPRS
ncbi:MAG TPA: hypothetical protein VMV18_14015 [bacterium]|nr:hypothetical protein [bacterium]